MKKMHEAEAGEQQERHRQEIDQHRQQRGLDADPAPDVTSGSGMPVGSSG